MARRVAGADGPDFSRSGFGFITLGHQTVEPPGLSRQRVQRVLQLADTANEIDRLQRVIRFLQRHRIENAGHADTRDSLAMGRIMSPSGFRGSMSWKAGNVS